jgi:hypothetical protein
MRRWALGLFLLCLGAAPASAFWPEYLPHCDNPGVLNKILNRYAWAERNTWHRGWTIAEFSGVRQSSLKDHGPSHIDRRYCVGTAYLTNGRESAIYYVIEAGQGFASIGWNVEFCLPAYDRWRIYDAWCQSIRP